MSTQAGDSGPICKVGLPFKLPDGYEPGDFLYGEDGPWPSQPTDGSACKIAPEVLSNDKENNEHYPHRIPCKEMKEWQDSLGVYYDDKNFINIAWDAIKNSEDVLGIDWSWIRKDIENPSIEAFIIAWAELGKLPDTGIDIGAWLDTEGRYPALSDAVFTDLIAHGLLSKLLTAPDPSDKDLFKQLLNDNTREFWKSDQTHMRVVRDTWADEYVAPAIVLLSRPKNPASGQEYDFQVHGIVLWSQSKRGGPYDRWELFQPRDGKSWQLAKYFALQGALVRINLIDHTKVHFPFDAINAITKSVLPKTNTVLELLRPHLLLSLPVDNAVLEGKRSLLNRIENYPYAPYPAKGKEIRKVFPFYWVGSGTAIDPAEPWSQGRDNAFPPFQFDTEPRAVPSRYGTFLNTYYKPILTFARGVVKSIPPESREWDAIRFWADHVASWIPGFPDGKAIYGNGELLASTCASIIWNCAIVHSADHWLMHEMFRRKFPTPYIMRDKPPQKPTPGVEPEFRPKVRLVTDSIPASLADLLFFRPHNTTLLIETTYGFKPRLQPLVDTFHQQLKATEAALRKEFPEFGIKLTPNNKKEKEEDCFAAGIQF